MKALVALVVAAAVLLLAPTAGFAAGGGATTTVAQLTPAPGQSDPTNLVASRPVPAVTSAVAAVKAGAPLPAGIVPNQSTLAAENAATLTEVPLNCLPPFGAGIENTNMCAVTNTFADRTVIVLGDSHAGNWIPAIEPLAQRMGLALVPMDKPGCFVNRLHRNLPGWPCGKWYQWALLQDHLLAPVATIVAFRMDMYGGAGKREGTTDLSAMLRQLVNPIYIADPPDEPQAWPGQCISQPGATMGTCSSGEWRGYDALMRRIGAALAQEDVPAIPTKQWFCADGTCPMVIDGTLVDRDSASDGGHMTIAYAQALSSVLSTELQPILTEFKQRPR